VQRQTQGSCKTIDGLRACLDPRNSCRLLRLLKATALQKWNRRPQGRGEGVAENSCGNQRVGIKTYVGRRTPLHENTLLLYHVSTEAIQVQPQNTTWQRETPSAQQQTPCPLTGAQLHGHTKMHWRRCCGCFRTSMPGQSCTSYATECGCISISTYPRTHSPHSHTHTAKSPHMHACCTLLLQHPGYLPTSRLTQCAKISTPQATKVPAAIVANASFGR
jgi:hypothetical protein